MSCSKCHVPALGNVQHKSNAVGIHYSSNRQLNWSFCSFSDSENDDDDDYLFNIEDEEKVSRFFLSRYIHANWVQWKRFTAQSVRIGEEYQAIVPEGLCRYDDALPYENEDKLLWDPRNLSERETEKYLTRLSELKCLNKKTEFKKHDAKKLSSVFKVRKRSRLEDSVSIVKDDEQVSNVLLSLVFS